MHWKLDWIGMILCLTLWFTLCWATGLASTVLGVQDEQPERTIKSDGYHLTFPSDWEIIEESKTIFTIRAPKDHEEDTFGENIRVVRHSVGREYSVEQVLKQQKSNLGRYKLLGDGTVEDAAVPMVWMALTPESPRDARDRRVKIDFITTRDQDVVVLTAMTEREVWERYLPIFQKIARTFGPLEKSNNESQSDE